MRLRALTREALRHVGCGEDLAHFGVEPGDDVLRRAGANMPYHVTFSKPGTPASATVGNSGTAGERCALPTARPFNLPLLTSGSTNGMLLKSNCTCPPSRSVTAGPVPL